MPRVSFGILLSCALALALAPLALAQTRDVRIDVRSDAQRRIRVHCESLNPSGDRQARTWSVQADEVLAIDLEQSAVFAVTRSWTGTDQELDVQAVITGKWEVRGDRVQLTGDVRDLPARRPILIKEYQGTLKDWRALVHALADDIVQQFTGEQGVASTRIAFSAKEGDAKELFVMDLDGAGLQRLTSDRSIAISPAWSPEGSLLLFTSFRDGQGPRIYVTPTAGGKTYLVSGRPGNNTTPAYAPDGQTMAATLSVDGNPEIYRMDARGRSPVRLTTNRSIDTSPSWSPTGQEVAFTSGRGGVPQVYLMDREGGNVRRLTFDMSYTDSPAWSPKGDRIAFVARTGDGFDIYTCRTDGADMRLVVSGGSNENPRWSPDARHLVFASNRDGTQAIWVTDLDGRAPRRLNTGGREASSPAWSPRVMTVQSAENIPVGP